MSEKNHFSIKAMKNNNFSNNNIYLFEAERLVRRVMG